MNGIPSYLTIPYTCEPITSVLKIYFIDIFTVSNFTINYQFLESRLSHFTVVFLIFI